MGIEPATTRSRVVRSTTELRRHLVSGRIRTSVHVFRRHKRYHCATDTYIFRQACFYLLPRLEHTSCEESNPTFFNCKSKVMILLNPVLECPLFNVLEQGQSFNIVYLFIQFFIIDYYQNYLLTISPL